MTVRGDKNLAKRLKEIVVFYCKLSPVIIYRVQSMSIKDFAILSKLGTFQSQYRIRSLLLRL